MRILTDSRYVRVRQTGVGYYVESMIRALDEISAGHSVEALVLDEEKWIPPPQHVKLRQTKIDYESHPAGEIFMNWAVPRMLSREEFDVYWGPAFLIPWRRTRARKIVTIHDLTVFTHPQSYPSTFVTYLKFVIRQSIRAADAVTCVSHAVHRELKQLFDFSGNVHVVHGAAPRTFVPVAQKQYGFVAGVERPYVLALGAGDPRKNTKALVDAFASLRLADRIEHDLVLVGERIVSPSQTGVISLTRQPREVILQLYQNADLFVFPSLYEGFGLPMLEAMACGCPVLASRAGALDEVGGTAAAYLQSLHREELEEALAQLLSNSQELARMREEGLNRSREFSWQRSAMKLLDICGEVLAQ